MAPDADHPTLARTLTATRMLWGDLCLDAVACELDAVACGGSRWLFFRYIFVGGVCMCVDYALCPHPGGD